MVAWALVPSGGGRDGGKVLALRTQWGQTPLMIRPKKLLCLRLQSGEKVGMGAEFFYV